ncbi:hypothetical protein CAPTEDRAFT_111094 [Capitella teleta]|uniref:BTB domain-containing protein n=1 Tax=Capitella teleta TaxID=283909 RepID=R7VL73_CAPTE|nr:hypothetical protein CAPTEDRAFT_111094 [Capitella teleta]|eukprot:ELU18016.1 hypothetical protein CAPTEDRAFT_111094 [Capitella teleta]
MTSLQRLKKNESSIDISLKLPDETTIPCHKLVLKAASPFFETMLQSGMKESTQQVVQLDFSDAVTIKMIIDYFYSGEIDINADNVQDLVAASEFLCLDDLKEHLGAFMTEQIHATNCIEFYRYARKFSLGKLIPHCLEHILDNFGQAFGSSNKFTELSEEELINVVSDDRLEAKNENIVFHYVVLWVNADRNHRKEAFTRIAHFIRFPFCTENYINNMICEELMINPSCMEFLREATVTKSSHIILHSMYSARHLPRLALFAVGGRDSNNGKHCSMVESFDENQNKWRPEPSLIHAVSKPYLVHFGTEVYALGGVDANGPSLATQEFDPVVGTWQLKKDMPGVCQSGAAVSLNDKIFVVGGTERVCFAYTPSTDTWATLSRPNHVHNTLTTAATWKGKILLLSDQGERYNPETDTWSPRQALVPTDGNLTTYRKGLFTVYL